MVEWHEGWVVEGGEGWSVKAHENGRAEGSLVRVLLVERNVVVVIVGEQLLCVV